MSEWHQQQYGNDIGGFYNPGPSQGSSYYGDYGQSGNIGGVTFMTPSVEPPFGANGYSDGDPGDEFANEPPLLEELGINPEHIFQKTLTVLNPFGTTRPDVAGDSDLAGPLVFCLALGSLLLLCGKVHFSYIYGIGVLGCLAMYGLLTLMATTPVSFCMVVSVLGYCILPIVMLAGLGILLSLQGIFGTICSGIVVIWCAMSASNLFVTAFGMEKQQLIVAYPCSLLYAVFALITIF